MMPTIHTWEKRRRWIDARWMDFQGMMVDFQGTIAWKPTTRRAATELMHLIFPNFRTGNFSCKRLWKNRRAGCHLLLLCCPPPKKKSAQELAINPSLHHAPHANSKPKTPSSRQPNSCNNKKKTHKHLQQRGKQKGNTGQATTPSHYLLQHPFSLISASTSKTACTQLQPNDKQEEVSKTLTWKPQILQLIDLIYDLLLHLKTKSTNPSSSLSSSSSPYTSLLSTMFATPYKH